MADEESKKTKVNSEQ